jgi:TBC1 domain family protein 5
MLGMGKAMSEYLASPLDQDSRNGLERVKDGLLGAGGRDLDELVKEWAWHEGLERSDLSGDGVISTTRSPDLPPKADISSNGVANLRSDQTPTLSTPTSTFDSTLASRKPPLVLSSRTDTGPLASLPRTPQTPRSAHPPSERLATHNRPFEPLGHPATGSLRQSEMTTTTAQKPPTTSGDPLGVGP